MQNVAHVGLSKDLTSVGNAADLMAKRFLLHCSERLGIQATTESLYQVIIVDFPKLGRLSQQDINQHCGYVRTALEGSPGKSIGVIIPPMLASSGVVSGLRGEFRPGLLWTLTHTSNIGCHTSQGHCQPHRDTPRRIEDKLAGLNVEVRPVTLSFAADRLHGNADRPTNFPAWLCILDSVLPQKGVAFRSRPDGHDATTSTAKSETVENRCLRPGL